MTYSKCPNCGRSINGFLGADIVSQAEIDFINKYTKASQPAYCTSCASKLTAMITDGFGKQKGDIEKRLQQIIHHIPVLTSPAPVKWDYEVIGIVTAPSTAGTGFTTELSRLFYDFFGTGSNANNRKIASATVWCKADLRVQCVRGDGNTVVSTYIDFSEMGLGNTNMFVVCIAGTAVMVSDTTNFNAKNWEVIAGGCRANRAARSYR